MVPVLSTFETFLRHNNQDSFLTVFDESTKEQKELLKYYEISLQQAEILAYLIKHRPNEVTVRKLNEILSKRDRDISSELTELANRGFISGRFMSDSIESCYRLRNEAYEAFRTNRFFGEQIFVSCLSEIKRVSFKTIFTKRWRNSMNRSLNMPSNSGFKEKLVGLGFESLDEDTKLAFWVMVYQFVNHFITPLAYRNGEDLLEGIDYSQQVLKFDLGLLVQEGLVQTLPIEPLEDTKDTDRFVLAPKVVEALFRGHDDLIRYDEVSKYADVIKSSDIVEKELFFSPDAKEEIDHLGTMLSRNGFERACRILKGKKRKPAIQSLLWGPPGTGKTEAVKQIAKETGRDLIMFDSAKLTASAWGATEKFYRALFRAYNYIAAISDNVPILLMNEADTMLSKRLCSIERAIEKSENAISNILLQAFEDMSGILLATTNLIDNLDPAFDRRFLFKTQLTKPDAAARAKIWKSSIPELTDAEARSLADKFDMSGAQISNVVAKRDLAELYFEGDRGYAYIAKLCEKELSTENGSKSFRPHIGF